MPEGAADLFYERIIRVLALLVLLMHMVAAAGWAWAMPSGFPLLHWRSFANRGMPLLVVGVVLACLVTPPRHRQRIAAATLIAFAIAWLAIGFSGLFVFPQSIRLPFVAAAGVGVMVAAIAGLAGWKALGRGWWAIVAGAVVAGSAVGVSLTLSQRAPRPSTVAATRTVADDDRGDGTALPIRSPTNVIGLSNHAAVRPAAGVVTLRHDGYTLTAEPLLTFESRSPDGFWTLFAPRDARVGPARQLVGLGVDGRRLTGEYRQDGRARLTVDADADQPRVLIVATTDLPTPVYTHLNSFLIVQVNGHQSLQLSFSPCPEERIAVKPFDYPVGEPARAAYAEGRDGFRVVEASSGEKGPFHELASGSLQRDEPLTITLYDGGRRFGKIVLHDWSAQASRELSPTAGWGLPQNAIEFFATRDGPPTAYLYVTLAGTSVGRGWDSVGHGPGVYHNQVELSLAGDDESTTPAVAD